MDKINHLLQDEQLTPSEDDSLDSEDVRRALETLGLEDEEGLQYRVSIMDYETGINHTIEVRIMKIMLVMTMIILWTVTCSLVSDECQLSSESLVFTSQTCVKGARADLVILSNIGNNLTDQSMVVYQVRMQSSDWLISSNTDSDWSGQPQLHL